MEKRIEVGLLYDFYGPLLTDRRKEFMRLYLEEDLSPAEIAAETGVTRQNVHDALGHAERRLAAYEAELNLLKRYLAMTQEIEECRAALEQVACEGESARAIDRVRQALDRIERFQ